MRAVGVTLAGLAGVYVAVLTLWILGVPRTEVASMGGGEGMILPGEPPAEPVQLVAMVLLSCGAAVASALLLWRNHPSLRSPVGVLVSALNVGALTALVAVVASPVAALATGPDPTSPAGEVITLSPSIGPLFFGPVVPGTSAPLWDVVPGFAGWFVLGTAAALLTLVYLVAMSESPDLRDHRPAAGAVIDS